MAEDSLRFQFSIDEPGSNVELAHGGLLGVASQSFPEADILVGVKPIGHYPHGPDLGHRVTNQVVKSPRSEHGPRPIHGMQYITDGFAQSRLSVVYLSLASLREEGRIEAGAKHIENLLHPSVAEAVRSGGASQVEADISMAQVQRWSDIYAAWRWYRHTFFNLTQDEETDRTFFEL